MHATLAGREEKKKQTAGARGATAGLSSSAYPWLLDGLR